MSTLASGAGSPTGGDTVARAQSASSFNQAINSGSSSSSLSKQTLILYGIIAASAVTLVLLVTIMVVTIRRRRRRQELLQAAEVSFGPPAGRKGSWWVEVNRSGLNNLPSQPLKSPPKSSSQLDADRGDGSTFDVFAATRRPSRALTGPMASHSRELLRHSMERRASQLHTSFSGGTAPFAAASPPKQFVSLGPFSTTSGSDSGDLGGGGLSPNGHVDVFNPHVPPPGDGPQLPAPVARRATPPAALGDGMGSVPQSPAMNNISLDDDGDLAAPPTPVPAPEPVDFESRRVRADSTVMERKWSLDASHRGFSGPGPPDHGSDGRPESPPPLV